VHAIPSTVLAEVPAVPENVAALRRAARRLAKQSGADDRVLADVTLAVSEACTNVVVHAYRDRPGTLALSGEARDGEVRFVVDDDGGGLSPRTDSPGLGLGLPLIARLTQRFEVLPGPRGRGTRLTMAFRV
jgi:serine/threonine-protein kinase RsbW/stage II sporulation protein AB (anti-sigma F factor)